MRVRSLIVGIALALSTVTVKAEPVVLKFAYFASDRDITWNQVLKPSIDAVNSDPRRAVRIAIS